MRFFQKQVQYETLHEKLTRARIEQSITLAMAEKFTDVNVKYLEAIEAGSYHLLPGEVYAENFIRRYAEFLGLESKNTLEEYRKERKITKNSSEKNQEKNCYRSLDGVSRFDFFAIPKILRRTMVGLSLFLFFIYLGSQIHESFKPPELVLFEPQEGEKVVGLTVEVRGKTEPEVDVSINGKSILTNQEGYFSQLVELAVGLNSIQVQAKKNHSRKSVVERNIFVAGDVKEDDLVSI